MKASRKIPKFHSEETERGKIINYKDTSPDFENFDFQGIDWQDLIHNTRSAYRSLRNAQYRPYLSQIHSKKLIKHPPKCKVSKGYSGYYKFMNFYQSLNPINGHFQLRHNLIAASYHDIYFYSDSAIIHFCTLRREKRLFPLPRSINQCCFSVFDDFLAVGDLEGQLYLHNIRNDWTIFSGKFLDDLQSHIVNCVKLYAEPSISSVRLIAASNEAKLRILDLEKPLQPIIQIKRDNPVNYFALSPDKGLLASYSDQKEAEVLDFKTGKIAFALEGHEDYGFSMDWHPEGIYLATGNQDTTARIWDIRSPKQAVHVLQGELGAIYSVKYSGDGRFLAAGESIDYVNLYDVKMDYSTFQQIDYFGETVGLDFNPEDSNQLFIAISIKDYDGVFEFTRRNNKTKAPASQLKNSFL